MDFGTALALGLVGSLHCAGMCGPLALALPASGATAMSFVAGRFAYNFGRILTYAALGLFFGAVGRTFVLVGFQRWLSIGLGVALLVGLLAARKLALWRPVIRLVERLKAPLTALLQQRSLHSLGVLGLLNGLLPCGLVYVACAAAAATGSIGGGAAYMAVFGLGTVPMMLAIGLSRKVVPATWRLKLARTVPVAVVAVAVLLILRGLSLGIPYLSPNLEQGGCCCPH